MAIFFDQSFSGLSNNGDIPNIAADFSVMFWTIPLNINSHGTDTQYRPYYYLTNVDGSRFVTVFTDPSNYNTNLMVDAGSGFISTQAFCQFLLSNAYNVCFTYNLIAQTLKYYINGTLIDTLTSIDFTDSITTAETLGTDFYGVVSNISFQNYISWDLELTADEIALQIGSSGAVVQLANVVNDTKFTNTSDLGDWEILISGTNYTTYDVKFISGAANSSFASALTIPYLPYKLVQNAKALGSALDLYYSYTTVTDDNVIGSWGYSPNATYNPSSFPYTSGHSNILGIQGNRVPIQFPVNDGAQYFLGVQANGAPSTAVLFLQIDAIGSSAVAVGDLADPDDTNGFPISVFRQGEQIYENVVTFRKPFVAGEQGDALDSGPVLMVDAFDAGKTPSLYSSQLIELSNIITLPTHEKFVRASNNRNSFFVVDSDISGSTAYELSNTGIIVNSWALGAIDLGTPGTSGAIAANNDGTILYYTNAGNEIKRWDLVNNIALTDFLPIATNYKVTDILSLSDDSLIISYFKNTVTRNLIVYRYDASGTLLNTYNLGVFFTSVAPRLSYSIGNPNTFWVWTHSSVTDGLMNFIEIQVSDGSEVNNIPAITFEGGTSQEDVTPTPRARFGGSFSCPFFQLRSSSVPPPNPLSGIYKIIPWSEKSNDTLYTSLDPVETEDVKIPDPTATTALFGE